MFRSETKTTRVKIGEKVKVYDLSAGKGLDLNLAVQQFKEAGAFDIAPKMSARVTIQVEHFVEGEPA